MERNWPSVDIWHQQLEVGNSGWQENSKLDTCIYMMVFLKPVGCIHGRIYNWTQRINIEWGPMDYSCMSDWALYIYILFHEHTCTLMVTDTLVEEQRGLRNHQRVARLTFFVVSKKWKEKSFCRRCKNICSQFIFLGRDEEFWGECSSIEIVGSRNDDCDFSVLCDVFVVMDFFFKRISIKFFNFKLILTKKIL